MMMMMMMMRARVDDFESLKVNAYDIIIRTRVNKVFAKEKIFFSRQKKTPKHNARVHCDIKKHAIL